MSSDPEITKKRKLEEGEHDVSIEKIVDMISIWDTTQLVSVLSKLAAQSTWALEAIKEENNKSVKLRKVFVRNLDFSTTDESLVTVFSQYGTVAEAVVIRNKSDNKSKGFGFVTFENTEGCERALQTPTHEIDGRTAYVNLAAKRTVTGDHGNGAVQGTPYGGGQQGSQHTSNPLTKLFVRSLSYQTTQQEFQDFFSQYGSVNEAVILTNKDGTSKGYGFLTFSDVDSANRALEQSQKQLGGRDIHCKLAAANDGHVSRNTNTNNYGSNQNQMGGQQFNNMNRMNMMNGMQQNLMSNYMMMGGQNMNQMGGGMGGGMGQANPYSALAQQQVGQQQQGNDQFNNLQQGLGGYQQQW